MMKNREFFPKEEKNNSSLFQKERKFFFPTTFQKYIVCYSLFNFLIFFFFLTFQAGVRQLYVQIDFAAM